LHKVQEKAICINANLLKDNYSIAVFEMFRRLYTVFVFSATEFLAEFMSEKKEEGRRKREGGRGKIYRLQFFLND
jgi:hypothetical protein